MSEQTGNPGVTGAQSRVALKEARILRTTSASGYPLCTAEHEDQVEHDILLCWRFSGHPESHYDLADDRLWDDR